MTLILISETLLAVSVHRETIIESEAEERVQMGNSDEESYRPCGNWNFHVQKKQQLCCVNEKTRKEIAQKTISELTWTYAFPRRYKNTL